MGAGICCTLVETESRDRALDIGSEFNADFNGSAVGDRLLARHGAAVPNGVKLLIDGNGNRCTHGVRDVACSVFRPGVEGLAAARGKGVGGGCRCRPVAVG